MRYFKVKIFSEKEIEMIRDLYSILPEKVFNKKQNVRKKAWVQNYNKELDNLYISKLKDALGDFKLDSFTQEKNFVCKKRLCSGHKRWVSDTNNVSQTQ